jgi:hypothetical protein
MDPIPIDAILPSPSAAARAALAAADVIIGIDQASQRQFTVYGTPPLESTTNLKRLSAMRVVQVLLDCNNQELERLMAVVRQIKGPETYEGTDE